MGRSHGRPPARSRLRPLASPVCLSPQGVRRRIRACGDREPLSRDRRGGGGSRSSWSSWSLSRPEAVSGGEGPGPFALYAELLLPVGSSAEVRGAPSWTGPLFATTVRRRPKEAAAKIQPPVIFRFPLFSEADAEVADVLFLVRGRVPLASAALRRSSRRSGRAERRAQVGRPSASPSSALFLVGLRGQTSRLSVDAGKRREVCGRGEAEGDDFVDPLRFSLDTDPRRSGRRGKRNRSVPAEFLRNDPEAAPKTAWTRPASDGEERTLWSRVVNPTALPAAASRKLWRETQTASSGHAHALRTTGASRWTAAPRCAPPPPKP